MIRSASARALAGIGSGGDSQLLVTDAHVKQFLSMCAQQAQGRSELPVGLYVFSHMDEQPASPSLRRDNAGVIVMDL